ncbi:MAG: tryptophan synthase subunit alpha [Bacteroidota bacterium]
MDRLQQLFERKEKDILNIYFTAGYPQLEDTETIIEALSDSGVDLIEVGMPYSDPLADGPTIQQSGQVALENGMTLDLLFEQLGRVRQKSEVPLIMMGYFNQVMQYGEEAFLQQCANIGIDALILPDLPLDVYETEYRALFEKYQLKIVFLITPQTSEERIRQVDRLSEGFIYMVSNASITGAKSGISDQQLAYFERINALNLQTPRLIGFGISNHETFATACRYARGAIIGSAFIKALKSAPSITERVNEFVASIKNLDPIHQ